MPHRLRVVLIDDEDDVRLAMEMVLTHLLPDKVKVKSFHPERYDEIDWTGIHVAIVDLMMPELTGEQVLAELQANHPEVYRVAWTARDRAYRNQLEATGLANEAVAKPGFDDVVELLRQVPRA